MPSLWQIFAGTLLPGSICEHFAVRASTRRGSLVKPFIVLDRFKRLLDAAFVFAVSDESVEALCLDPHRLPLVDLPGEDQLTKPWVAVDLRNSDRAIRPIHCVVIVLLVLERLP